MGAEDQNRELRLRKCPFSTLYLSFEGRIGRAKYWLLWLPLLAAEILGLAIDIATIGEKGLVSLLFVLLTLVPHFAIQTKRCHDRNRSGTFFLVCFIPVLCLWYLIEVGFLRGTEGSNEYGPDPNAERSLGVYERIERKRQSGLGSRYPG